MIKIAWIYGSSAVGKETFIRRVLSDPDQDLLARLGWEDKGIVCIEESLKYIAQFANDPVVEKRMEIMERVKEILEREENVVILIKGQDVDLEKGLPSAMQKEFPQAKHQIIFLHADMQLLYERVRTKDWWDEEDEAEGIEGLKDWLLYQLKYLLELKGFEIIALDSTDHQYTGTTFASEIN